MIVSLNEIESLTLKACRGAGMSWGLAEEAAQAARWLAHRGFAWDRSLAALLTEYAATTAPVVDDQTIVASQPGAPLCPVRAGAAVSDLLDLGHAWTVNDVLQPIWLMAIVHRRVQPGTRVTVATSHGDLVPDAVRRGLAEDDPSRSDRIAWIRIDMCPGSPSPVAEQTPPFGSILSDGEIWKKLELFAALTYVPASLQSRLAGAGAGVFDND